MNPLRSKGHLTRLLILLEVVNNRHANLKGIAANLDVTTQAVSEYNRKMVKEGLMDQGDGYYRATKEGVLYLQDGLFELKSFVDEKISTLDVIKTCTAIAGKNVNKGQKVGLFMKEGLLYASPGKRSTSTGEAIEAALKGSILNIGHLEGILELSPGTLTLLEMSSGTAKVKKADIKKELGKQARVAALDLESIGLLRNLKLPCHYEYANLPLVINNLERGLNVVCLGNAQQISSVIQAVTEHNKRTGEKIRYEYKALG
jgi:putative transcriptional regulator